MKREIQRTQVDVDDAKDVSGREVARLRAENERLKTERDLEQYRTPRRVPSEPDLRIPSISSPGRNFRTDGQVSVCVRVCVCVYVCAFQVPPCCGDYIEA